MTLKQLQAFHWAAVAASFAVAAERLHVSQSTLSKRIAELEAQLRTPLFDRSGHRAVLTEAGERLLPLARQMLGLADEMAALVADGQGLQGHCRFGVGELAALTWLPDLVSHAAAKYPELRWLDRYFLVPPVIYAVARQGQASLSLEERGKEDACSDDSGEEGRNERVLRARLSLRAHAVRAGVPHRLRR